MGSVTVMPALSHSRILRAAESPTQLIGEVRQSIPATPGQRERYDCEYKRNGTANLFVFLDVHRPWRKVKVTNSRAAVDFATCMRELADVHLPKAERIRVVLDRRGWARAIRLGRAEKDASLATVRAQGRLSLGENRRRPPNLGL